MSKTSFQKNLISTIFTLALISVLSSIPSIVFASGSGMPWEGPMNKLLSSLTGPWLKFGSTACIVFAGLGLAFGNAEGFVKKLVGIILGLSIACSAGSWGLSFIGFSGGACF